jgi:hypothetical protein
MKRGRDKSQGRSKPEGEANKSKDREAERERERQRERVKREMNGGWTSMEKYRSVYWGVQDGRGKGREEIRNQRGNKTEQKKIKINTSESSTDRNSKQIFGEKEREMGLEYFCLGKEKQPKKKKKKNSIQWEIVDQNKNQWMMESWKFREKIESNNASAASH